MLVSACYSGGFVDPLKSDSTMVITAARADRICPPAHAEALWVHWGRPRIHWYPGGHLAQFRRYRALRQIRKLLRETGLLPATLSRRPG